MTSLFLICRGLTIALLCTAGPLVLAQTAPAITAPPAKAATSYVALRDSLTLAAKLRQQAATSATEAAKKAFAAGTADDKQVVATLSLRGDGKKPYPVYTNISTRDFNRVVKLSDMNFYLENGRLLRVVVRGTLLTMKTRQEVLPTLEVLKKARTAGKKARASRAAATTTATANITGQAQANQAAADAARAKQKSEQAAATAAAAKAAAKTAPAKAAAAKLAEDAAAAKVAYERSQRQAEVLLDLAGTPQSPASTASKAAAAESTAVTDEAAATLATDTLARPYVAGQSFDSTLQRLVTHTDTSATGPELLFTNGSTSIDLNRAATGSIGDMLYAEDTQNFLGVGLRYNDLVRLEPRASRRLIAADDNWKLTPFSAATPGAASHNIHAGSSLGSLIDVALYTDLLAVADNQDNALVTTEARSLLPLNQRPLWANGSLFPVQFIRPFLTLSRLDSKFDTLRLRSDNTLDRPDLLQRAYLRFGADLNLLSLDTRGHVTWQLNTSWTRTLTSVVPSRGSDPARNVYQNLYGLEMLATVRRQQNFGCDLYFTAFLHNVQSRRPVENTEAQWALRPGALFYYHPFGSVSNKIFFRVANYIFPEGRQRDFVQLQFGYSIGLDGFLSGGGAGTTGAGTLPPSP